MALSVLVVIAALFPLDWISLMAGRHTLPNDVGAKFVPQNSTQSYWCPS